jgi:hypothetical protein
MRRPVLITLAAVGGVIVLLGGTGIFAALSDTARSQTNYIDSGALAPSADLQVATAQYVGNVLTCGQFTEDLTSTMISIVGPPGADNGQSYPYCLRNVGSQSVDLTVLAENLSDFEMDCTGDESAYDTGCGPGMGLGELGDIVQVSHQQFDCATGAFVAANLYLLRDTSFTPVSLGTLGPNETRCFAALFFQSNSTGAQRQAAQSDRLLWQFAWTGQA